MGPTRLGMRAWLEAQINSGKYKGLHWVNRNEGTFQISWKHASGQDWKSEDASLFKQWAIHTGKFREGIDEPNYKTWKANFRCAANSVPDIKMLRGKGELKGTNATRIFKFSKNVKSKTNVYQKNNRRAALGKEHEKKMPRGVAVQYLTRSKSNSQQKYQRIESDIKASNLKVFNKSNDLHVENKECIETNDAIAFINLECKTGKDSEENSRSDIKVQNFIIDGLQVSMDLFNKSIMTDNNFQLHFDSPSDWYGDNWNNGDNWDYDDLGPVDTQGLFDDPMDTESSTSNDCLDSLLNDLCELESITSDNLMSSLSIMDGEQPILAYNDIKKEEQIIDVVLDEFFR